MTDSRYEAARAKLRRFLPPPPPDRGWGFVRQCAEAQFLGPLSDDQASLGESQLLFPAILSKETYQGDGGTYTWDWSADEHTWTFTPTASPYYGGATGDWLDMWGATFAVPREPNESDALYSIRILAELLRPTTTNVGMAQAIDQGLGVTGTEVLEAETALTIYRLNSPGKRLNSYAPRRLNMAGIMGENLWACFLVRIPSGAQVPYDASTVERMVARRKAAGTRLLGVYTTDGGAITTSTYVTTGATVSASIPATAGASYAWRITNGVIDSGDGTTAITWHALADGPVTLRVVVTVDGGTATYWKETTAFPSVAVVISGPEYLYAGTFAASASIPPNLAVTWSGTNMEIEGPANQTTVSFTVGTAGLASLAAHVRNAAGATGDATLQIKVVPYTSDATHTTATIASMGYEDFTIDLGWEYLITRMATDYPATLRVYNTAADRAADAARTLTVDPISSTAIVYEGTTSAALLAFDLTHLAEGVNGDTPRSKVAYCRIFNVDTVPRPIALTITRTETRTSGTF